MFPASARLILRKSLFRSKVRILVFFTAAMLFVFPALGISAERGPSSAIVRATLTKGLTRKALVERGIDILHVYSDGRADLAVTDEELRWIESRGAAVSLLEKIDLAAPSALDENLGQYHTYAEMNALLDSLAAAEPSLARVETIGASYEGRAIRAMKISDNVTVDENEPELLIMGCHHSREIMSVEVTLLFARHLLANYGGDPVVTNLVDTREVWIVPMLNVDGHVYVEQNHDGSAVNWFNKNRRPNGDGSYGVDLNRNYGFNWGYDDEGSSPDTWNWQYRGTAPFSESETRAVRDLCAGRHFAISLSYHSYGEQILFPWGYAPLNTPDNDVFFSLGNSMRGGSGYEVGNAASGTIYITNGDSDDWLYGDTQTKNRVFGFTIELNSYDDGGYEPAESLIAPTCAAMFELNLAAMELAGDVRLNPGPLPPVMSPVTATEPPEYEVSWSGASPYDPHPPVSYELTEMKNLESGPDSIEAPATLWTTHGFTLSSARVAAGAYSFYSGRGNNLDNTVAMAAVYPAWFSATLTCRLWYDLETDWDYAYLEGSADDGLNWSTLPGNRTTSSNPNGTNRGNGITGSSGGWVEATFDLSGLVGSGTGFVILRFVCVTDESNNNEGVYVDLVDPVPRFERSSVIASGFAETEYLVSPAEIGDFTYYVRGVDAAGKSGRRSNLAAWQVTEIPDTTTHTPAVSRLAQNYPNPFNAGTRIVFTVGAADAPGGREMDVSLRLYDVSGRMVATIMEGRRPAGEHSVDWNGLGVDGKPVSSGLYFAELKLSGRIFVRKMIILR
jgi:carboxypeptidase T